MRPASIAATLAASGSWKHPRSSILHRCQPGNVGFLEASSIHRCHLGNTEDAGCEARQEGVCGSEEGSEEEPPSQSAVYAKQTEHWFPPERCSCTEALYKVVQGDNLAENGVGRVKDKFCKVQLKGRNASLQHDRHAVRCVCAEDAGTHPCTPCAESVPAGGHPEQSNTNHMVFTAESMNSWLKLWG